MKEGRSFFILAIVFAGFFVTLLFMPISSVLAYWEINTDTVWRTSDSPIIVRDSVWVKPGIKLTIEPGVVIKFGASDPYKRMMIIQGSVEAIGTADQPIIFTSIKDDSVGGDSNADGGATNPKSGDWWQLNFQNNSSSTLKNVVIRYGGYNDSSVINNYRSRLVISNTTITNNKGVVDNNEGDLIISNSAIYNNLTTDNGSDYYEIGINNYGRSGYVKTVMAKNNWWGTESGPCPWTKLVPVGTPPWQIDFPALCGRRPIINDLVEYDPWLRQEPDFNDIKKPNPVIVIPGIMGSWQNWRGEWEIDPILHTYDDLLEAMRLAGYKDGETLFTFPYQWRRSNVITASQLKDKIMAVKSACKGDDFDCSKVDLVGHSMGGLVARAYIEGDNYQNDVDQLIFIATPHKGAPKAYLMWEGGELEPGYKDLAMSLILKNEASENGYSGEGALARYIKEKQIYSVKELLPIYNYLFDFDINNLRHYPNNYPSNEFLELLNNQNNLSKLNNIRVTNIVGDTGFNTLNALYLASSTKANLWEDGMPKDFYNNSESGLFYGEGDETVPHISNLNIFGNNIILNYNHGLVVSHAQKKIIKELLDKELESEIHNFKIPNLLLLTMHSPADFNVTDPSGRKIGRDFSASNSVINEIPGAFYSGFRVSGQPEFVVIPNPMAGEYRVMAKGTGYGGAYSVSADFISETTSTSASYSGQILPDQDRNISFTMLSENNSFDSVVTDITIESAIKDVGNIYDRGLLTGYNNKQKIIQQYNWLKLKLGISDKLIGLAIDGINKLNVNSKLKPEVRDKLVELANNELDKLRQVRVLMVKDFFNDLNRYSDKLVAENLLKPLGYDIIKANNGYLINNL